MEESNEVNKDTVICFNDFIFTVRAKERSPEGKLPPPLGTFTGPFKIKDLAGEGLEVSGREIKK